MYDHFVVGVKIFSACILLFVLWRRACSVLFLICRYAKDKTSIQHRMYFPHWYEGRKLGMGDKISYAIFRLVPDLAEIGDYKNLEGAYRLFESDKLWLYVRKIWLSTVISIGFNVCVILGYLDQWFYKMVLGYLWVLVIFSWVHFISVRGSSGNLLFKKRWKVLRLTLMDIIYRWSFGVFDRDRKIKIGRNLLINLVLIIVILILRRYGHEFSGI